MSVCVCMCAPLGADFVEAKKNGIGASIRIGQEIQGLPCAGFFLDNFFKMISRGMSKNNFIFFQVDPIFFLFLLEGGPNFLFFLIFILIGGWKRLE